MNNKVEPRIENRGFNFVDACKYIGGVSRNTMYTILNDGKLPSYTIGTRRYFTRECLDNFINELSEEERKRKEVEG
jgi:excisionase family DNA binding protein